MSEREQQALVHGYLSDPWWRLDNLYHVVNEQGVLVPFRMRPAQRQLFREMHEKNLILKAHQLGFSTAIDLYLLDQALFSKNVKCGIVAQDKQAAAEIFRTKIEVPFDHLPGWLAGCFHAVKRHGGASGGYIEFAHGSNIMVATSFRSGTVQRLHISEHGKICAKYPAKAKEVRTGSLNAVAEGSIVFIESTAEGVGGDFYDMSLRAQEMAQSRLPLSSQDYKFHFYAWWQDPKYAVAVPPGGLRLSRHHQDYFADVEQAMRISLSDRQKWWYVRKEAEQQQEMKQEFPSTPREAFLTSGRRVFSSASMLQAEGRCAPPALVYDIDPVTGRKNKMQALRQGASDVLQRQLLNYLLIWELPDPDEVYAIGADVAEGLERRDRSSLDVVKQSSGEQVAHWVGYLDAELFAMLLDNVGRLYGMAYIGVERNNHGHAVLQKLRALYPPRYLYNEQFLNQDTDDETRRLGWLTTRQSKPILIEGLKTLLREAADGLRWIGSVSEMNTYVYDKNGAMGAQAGCYDDQVMSYALAQEMRVRMPARRQPEPIKHQPAHWMTR
ncbi:MULTISPECIES: terminase [Edwardsiella]|uniref:Terminase n=2 Tax=Edwardsiella anguillarum TaxID=1821960 RepID=A0ABY8SLG3_9GAMM|nr:MULTISPECIES: terminase [Edwardsiella]AKR79388.1 terminase [Edwardsiella sp. LADL05-105]UOU80891.1 terminase [Edwardsiella anguillarum]WHP85782.1 terminase [Edwardsiella anguillarum]WHP89570.1 terminase [Edwardsiella anguillarum]WHP93370.1 terminase [Edwardsiella anguillarum]